MKREDALKHFEETYVKEKVDERLFAQEAYYQKNKDVLKSDFVESFRRFCLKIKKMQSSGEKGRIGYLTYSMLRTSLIERNYNMLIEAFNEEWFLDFDECQEVYNAGWAFKPLEELGAELEGLIKPYIGSLVSTDVERIKLKSAEKFLKYITSLARYAMPEIITLKEYLELQREEVLEIRVGEYRDKSEIVYKEDIREKDSKEIKEWLEKKLEDGYCYEVLTNLELSGGNYKGIDLRYTDFGKSKLSKSNMAGCVLLGAKFNEGDLEGSNLSNSFIYGVDFSRCKLKGATFYRAEGPAGVCGKTCWEMPGFSGVNFREADLEGTDFESADLRGAVFTGANLKDTNFLGANLENAVFSEKDADILDLDERQSRVVKWIR